MNKTAHILVSAERGKLNTNTNCAREKFTFTFRPPTAYCGGHKNSTRNI